MPSKMSKIKADNRSVHLFTGKDTHVFPLYDPSNAHAGYDFLADCLKDGCPVFATHKNIYVWMKEGGWS